MFLSKPASRRSLKPILPEFFKYFKKLQLFFEDTFDPRFVGRTFLLRKREKWRDRVNIRDAGNFTRRAALISSHNIWRMNPRIANKRGRLPKSRHAPKLSTGIANTPSTPGPREL
jgi:hypothetical protein